MNDLFDEIYCKSARELPELPKLSIDLVLTSPPYETMRHYSDNTEDLGNYQGVEYVAMLKAILSECLRVLKPTGNLFLNFQAQSTDGLTSPTEYLIPKMAVEELGLLHVQTHFWHKPNANPLPARQTVKNSVEFIWHFAKTRDFVVHKDAIREASEWAAKDKRTYKYHELGKDPGNCVLLPKSQDQKDIHPAKMPDALADRFIRYGSKPGDVVLDPFCGSGTTLIAARKLDRRFVGYDLNPDYVKLAKTRLNLNTGPNTAPSGPGADMVPSLAPAKPWMNVGELATYIGLAPATIYSKICRGEIPVTKMGRMNRFNRAEIDNWLLNQGAQNTAKPGLGRLPAEHNTAK